MHSAATQLPPKNTKATVLFVDDEPRVLTSMRAMFRRHYQVKTAPGAAEALAILASQPVDVVVSDQRMPGTTGVELLARLKTQYPHCMRILLTGYADLEAIEASINESEVFRYLVKPCPPDELKRVVELAVEAARADLPETVDTAPVKLAPVPTRVADVAFDEEPEYPLLTQAVSAPDEAQPDALVAQAAHAETSALLEPSTEELASAHQGVVDVLVLSRDDKLHSAVAEAMADELTVHHVKFLDEALDLMAVEPVGVLVTDLAVNEHEVSLMTRELKQQVPHLITILAAQRSDANLLIDLINQGQVFRFLLKPVPQAQCRIWLRSAVNKHRELLQSPNALLRHVVDQPADVEDGGSGQAGPGEPGTVAAAGTPAAGSLPATDSSDSSASLLRHRGGELRSLLQERSVQVARRMEAFVGEPSKVLAAVRKSAPARTVAARFSALKQRINEWKASHG